MSDNKKSSIGGRSTTHLLNVKQPERTANRIKLSFQRIAATITTLKTGHTVTASMGFLDISESGAGFFTSELLLKGSTIEAVVTEPQLLKVKGVVAWSVPVKSGVHGGRLKYRTGMQFVFEGDAHRSAVIEFIQKIHADPLENIRQSLAAASAVAAQPNPMPATGLAPDGQPLPAAVPGADPAAVTAPVAGAPVDTTAPPVDPAASPVAAAPVDPAAPAAPAVAEAPAPAAPAEAATPIAAVPPPSEGEGGGQSQAA